MKKDINKIIHQIRKEVSNLNNALEILEVARHSIKREKYCKKYKIDYVKFMQFYQTARNEILMYPVIIHGMKAIIDLRRNIKKEYEVLHENIVQILQEMIEKAKEQDKPAINEMEKVLADLKKDKPKVKTNG